MWPGGVGAGGWGGWGDAVLVTLLGGGGGLRNLMSFCKWGEGGRLQATVVNYIVPWRGGLMNLRCRGVG